MVDWLSGVHQSSNVGLVDLPTTVRFWYVIEFSPEMKSGRSTPGCLFQFQEQFVLMGIALWSYAFCKNFSGGNAQRGQIVNAKTQRELSTGS